MLLQFLKVTLRDVPVPQPLQAAFHQLVHACQHLWARVLDRLHALHGDQVFLLRGDEIGAVNIHQRLALLHRLARGVDVELLDPALEPRRHGVQAPLVRLHDAHRAHGSRQFAHCRSFRAHAELLHLVDVDFHQRAAVGRLLSFIDGHVVHAHRVFLGHGRCVGQPHGVPVIEDLSRRLGQWTGALRLCVNRDVVHAVRSLLGYRRDIGEAHRVAVVKNLALGFDGPFSGDCRGRRCLFRSPPVTSRQRRPDQRRHNGPRCYTIHDSSPGIHQLAKRGAS